MDNIKTLQNLREQVKKELDRIPRGDLNQNILRQAYWTLRMNSLGKKAKKEGTTKEEVLIRAIRFVRKDNKNFNPRFDGAFFNLKSVK